MKPSELDPVVHEPVRLSLMVSLNGREADFTYLKTHLGLTDGNLLFHLRKLAEAGYLEDRQVRVTTRRVTFYGLTEAGERALAGYREAMKRLLAPGLPETAKE